MKQKPNNRRSYTSTGFDSDVYARIIEELQGAPEGTSFHDVVNDTLRKGLGMDAGGDLDGF
jgi:hypothetical protein